MALPDPMLRNSARVPNQYTQMTDAYGRMRNLPAGPANLYQQKPGPNQPIAGFPAFPPGMTAAQGPNTFGYGTTPGSGPGYFEQQTPVGSFVAGQTNTASGRPDLRTATASNPYLGATSGQAAGQAPTMGYGAAAARYATGANPYLGQTTAQVGSAGRNAYAGDNPFLQQQINATTKDATTAFNDVVNPQFDRMAQASGSFGNTGVEAARNRAMGEFGQNLANTVSGMRMQDYSNQQQLAESALNRNQQVNLANAGFNAGDLNRNMGGYLQGQGLGLQGLGMQQAGAQFDANLGQGLNTFNASLGQNDLTRNSNLAQNLGQFNASALNNMGQFNQSQGNNLSMFNAGQANNMGQFNASAGNNMLENYRNRQQRGDEFNQNMDFQTWMANNQNMRNGTRDQLDYLNTLLGFQNQGINASTNQQNTPLNYFNQFQQMLNQFGNQGTVTAADLQGNPMLAFMGMMQMLGLGNTKTG